MSGAASTTDHPAQSQPNSPTPLRLPPRRGTGNWPVASLSPPPVMRQKMLAPRRGAGNALIKKILVPGPVPFEISNLQFPITFNLMSAIGIVVKAF